MKSIIIFIIGASLSLYLNTTYGQNTSLSSNELLGTLTLLFIAGPMTLVGFVLIIYNIDFMIKNTNNDKNNIKSIYYYIKGLFGVTLTFVGLYIVIHSFIISTDKLTTKTLMFTFIMSFGFILYGFRMMKSSKDNLVS